MSYVYNFHILFHAFLQQIPTWKDNKVDVIFGCLKLVGDTQITENIFLFQPGEFPTEEVNGKNIFFCYSTWAQWYKLQAE